MKSQFKKPAYWLDDELNHLSGKTLRVYSDSLSKTPRGNKICESLAHSLSADVFEVSVDVMQSDIALDVIIDRDNKITVAAHLKNQHDVFNHQTAIVAGGGVDRLMQISHKYIRQRMEWYSL